MSGHNNIREWRDKLGISLADFGKLVFGKPAITVKRWEEGTEPATDTDSQRIELILRLWQDVDSVRHVLEDKHGFQIDTKQWDMFSAQLKGALQIATDPLPSVNKEYNAKTIVGTTMNLLFIFDQASLQTRHPAGESEKQHKTGGTKTSELGLREPDDDLIPLLRKCTDEELSPLVDYIVKKGSMSSLLETTKAYKEHQPHHHHYADEIAAEIQAFGGHTLRNIFRGTGVTYAEIVRDVAKRRKVAFDKDIDDVPGIELRIHLKVMQEAWKKMSDEEKKGLLTDLGLAAYLKVGIPKALPLAAIQTAINVSTGLTAYSIGLKVTLNVANAASTLVLGKGLQLGTNAAIASVTTRGISFLAGPIGWAITGLLTAYQLAGPAYRVTIPCVLHIGMLRRLKQFEEAKAEGLA